MKMDYCRQARLLITLWLKIPVVALMLLLSNIVAEAHTPAGTKIGDIYAAREMCDTLPLTGPEGIWKFDADKVTVLILRDEMNSERWNITVVESDDTALRGGDLIGWLESTTDPRKYRLNLFTTRKRGTLCKPGSCSAILSEQHESLRIERTKLKITFNPLGFLPHFWRSIRVKVSNPAKELPEGMIRIYPSYDGNGSSRRKPRYL